MKAIKCLQPLSQRRKKYTHIKEYKNIEDFSTLGVVKKKLNLYTKSSESPNKIQGSCMGCKTKTLVEHENGKMFATIATSKVLRGKTINFTIPKETKSTASTNILKLKTLGIVKMKVNLHTAMSIEARQESSSMDFILK